VGAPIWVADEVIEEAGVDDFMPEEDASERLDEFKRFLDDVEPEDFA
jgi:bifunctional DNase/RNase